MPEGLHRDSDPICQPTLEGEAAVASYYDDLSAFYHLLYPDWDRAVATQGHVVSQVIARLLGEGPRHILDAACGIGTQAIGLALSGHKVHGTDLSPAAVLRARREAERLGAQMTAGVADLRVLSGYVAGPFDAVCALDDALPHLRDDEEIATALTEIASVLAPGGLFLASMRDYERLAEDRPRATPVEVFEGPAGRRVVFQVWDWLKGGRKVRLTQYVLTPGGESAALPYARAFHTDLWPLGRERLEGLLQRCGFESVAWIEPGESGFYQPLVAARTAATREPSASAD